MIEYLKKMQTVCLEVKENNEGACPAGDNCPLYQYCAAGRSYGIVEGAYGPTHVKLIEQPNIVPWNAKHLQEIAVIVNDYAFKL